MNKEEIKEYLKKVDELEFKLVDEDKDTLQWLIFGYNEYARLLNEKEKENQRLKEIEKEHQRINGDLRVEIKELKDRIDKAFEIIDLIKPELWNISNKMTYRLLDVKTTLKGDKE